MKLRRRLFLTLLLIALPVAWAVGFADHRRRREAVIEQVYEATMQNAQRRGESFCVAWEQTEDRPRRRRRLRRRARRALRQISVYDISFQPLLPRMQQLPASLRQRLQAGELYAGDYTGQRLQVAMQLPWEGACVYALVDRPMPVGMGAGGLVRTFAISGGMAFLVALLSFLVLGPPIRRMRRLAEAVRAQSEHGYREAVAVEGKDEVADLANAFNEASAEVRRQMAELEARDATLRDFLGRTTHDVMVPLSVLAGHLTELRRARDAGEPLEKACLASALEETSYLTSLLRNLNAVARLEMGDSEDVRHPTSLSAVVERVVQRHGGLAREREVQLNYGVPDGPVMVKVDPTLVEQALGNLVQNAIRYNCAGGHVAVVLSVAGSSFALSVTDDGPGIHPAALAKLAEPRFRGGEARKRHPDGLGLGLHIVRDVIERHDWSLAFQHPDEGGLRVLVEGNGCVASVG